MSGKKISTKIMAVYNIVYVYARYTDHYIMICIPTKFMCHGSEKPFFRAAFFFLLKCYAKSSSVTSKNSFPVWLCGT